MEQDIILDISKDMDEEDNEYHSDSCRESNCGEKTDNYDAAREAIFAESVTDAVISKGTRVALSRKLWKCLADVTSVRLLSSSYEITYHHTVATRSSTDIIEGTVAWISEEKQMIAIETDEPVFQGHGIPEIQEDHGILIPEDHCKFMPEDRRILLPHHLVQSILQKGQTAKKPCISYNMTCQPHGLGLVIADTRTDNQQQIHSRAYYFLKIFKQFNYSVQHYTFNDNDQLMNIANKLASIDHSSFDSFTCYMYLAEEDPSTIIINVLEVIKQCTILENKPKIFFIKTKFPLPLSSIPLSSFQDTFLMIAAQESEAVPQFEVICHSVFRQHPHDDLLSMAANASVVKYMTKMIDDDYAIFNQLKGPVYFNDNHTDVLSDNVSEILQDDKLRDIKVSTRCSYVSVMGPPSSGKSLVMKMLRDEPKLFDDTKSSMVFCPEVNATSLVALNASDLSQPFKDLNTELILTAAKSKFEAKSIDLTARSSSHRFMSKFRVRKNSSRQQKYVHLVHVINSNGHPFFVDIFAHLLKHHSFNIITHKLSKTLNDKISFKCSLDGQVIDSPCTVTETNFSYIKELARALTDMSLHENPSLLILGTFINSLTDSLLQYESLEEKSEKLKEMLDQFRGISQVYNQDEHIFVIDAMMRSGREEPAAKIIRQKICESFVPTEIPVRWLLLQHQLVKHHTMSGESVVTIKFCYEMGQKLELEEYEVKKAIELFCSMTIFLYFPDVLPEIIFLHPQLILDKLSEIWCLSDSNITEELKKNKAAITNAQKQLQLKGVFEQSLISQHFTDGFSDLFTPNDFLKITDHLSIILFLPENKLFFPKVLPEVNIKNVPFTQSEIIPIVFNWNKKLIPKSFYFKIIQQLLQRSSYPTFKFVHSSDTQIYRNAIYLTNPEIEGVVVLVDAMKWLEVHYTGPPQGRKCHLIKSVILEAISNVLKLREYRALKIKELQTCFFCTCDKAQDTKHHLCVLFEEDNTLTCCSDGVSTYDLNGKQQLWFSENVNDDSTLTAKALADGSVNITFTKFVIFGSPNSGINSTMKFLLSEDLQQNRGRRFHFLDTKNKSPTQTKMQLVVLKQRPEKGDVTWELSDVEFKPQEMRNQNIHLVLGIESGENATFLDIAPFLMGPSSVILFTQALDTRFEEMTKFYYNVGDNIIEEPEEFQISHLQLFQETLRYFLSSNFFKPKPSHDFGNKPLKVFVIGTRDDLQVKLFGRALGETASNKSQIIQLQCQEYTSKIIKYREDRDKIIFPVNNLSRDESSLEVAGRLRKLISEHNIKFRIPLSWCELLYKLKDLNIASDLIEISKCIEIGRSDCGLDTDSVIAALKFFNDKRIFYYFPTILPEIVFLRPQLILYKLSELVSLGFPKMASIMYRDLPTGAHENMSKYGIFNRQLLKEFFWKGIPNVFTVDGFLALMERWSIIAPLGRDNYFMLRALPTAQESFIASLRESYTNKASALVINWDAPIPQEIFLTLFISLLNREVEPVFKYIQSYAVNQKRNALQLQCSFEEGNLLIIDAGKWLEVCYSGVPEKCHMILDAIDLEITNVFKKFGYNRSYRICFFCDEHKEDEQHFSSFKKDKNVVTCSKSKIHVPPNEKQKYWLKPAFNYSTKRPQVTDLMKLFDPFSEHWYEIGLKLLVPDASLQWIQHRAMKCNMKMNLVLQEWDKMKELSPITWEFILDMISREPINKPSLRHEIEIMAEKSVTALENETLKFSHLSVTDTHSLNEKTLTLTPSIEIHDSRSVSRSSVVSDTCTLDTPSAVSDVYQENIHTLSNALGASTNFTQIVNELFSKRLLTFSLIESIKTTTSSEYERGSKVILELYRVILSSQNQSDVLCTICDILEVQGDNSQLKDIGQSMRKSVQKLTNDNVSDKKVPKKVKPVSPLTVEPVMITTSLTDIDKLSEATSNLTVEDIADYLRYLKLDVYIETFVENEIDGDMMLDIDDDMLTSLGIDVKKDRLKIIGKFKQWLRKRQ